MCTRVCVFVCVCVTFGSGVVSNIGHRYQSPQTGAPVIFVVPGTGHNERKGPLHWLSGVKILESQCRSKLTILKKNYHTINLPHTVTIQSTFQNYCRANTCYVTLSSRSQDRDLKIAPW